MARSINCSLLIAILFITSFNLFAQEINKKNNYENKNAPITKGIDGITTTGDKVTIIDGTTTLLEINSEGTAGSITIPSLSTIGTNTNKLYNLGGLLYWNGNALGTSSSAGGWTHSGTSIYPTTLTDNVGIGTTTPLSVLHIITKNYWGPSEGSGWGDFSISDGTLGLSMGVATAGGGAGDVRLWTRGGTERLIFSNVVYGDILSIENNNVGIGVLSPTTKLDVRAATIDDDAVLSLGNSDLSHQVTIFPGRDTDPNPFIRWKNGDPLRFAVDPGSPSFFTELMRIESNGNVGIGTTNPSSKLEINGQVKITGGAPANGKVLTSDASGLATWQDNANPNIAFSARLNNDINAVTGTETQLQDFSEKFDDGNNFNPVTGVFIIPAAGVYQFSLNVSWSSASTLSDIPTTIRIKVNTTIIRQFTHKVQLNSSWGSTTFISGIVKANASDQITFTALYASGTQVTVDGGISNSNTDVSGFRIY